MPYTTQYPLKNGAFERAFFCLSAGSGVTIASNHTRAELDLPDTAAFLFLVIIGAYVQTITGFAMGLLIVGGVTILNLAPITFTAAIVGILSLANTSLILRHALRQVDRRFLLYLSLGMLPSIFIGVAILNSMSDSQTVLLRKILGAVIIIAGILLTLKPEPRSSQSSKIGITLTGIAGGLFGGMFSTGGAPPAFLMYRQPLALTVIRATLLAVFFITTLTRTVLITIDGQLTPKALTVCAIAVPLVLVTTHYAPRFAPTGADKTIRKSVFILLIIIGLLLIIK